MPMNRRAALRGLAATTALVVSSCSDHADAPSSDLVPPLSDDRQLTSELFPLGVQAGSMRLESVILWSYSTHKGQHWFAVWPEDSDPLSSAQVHEVESHDGYLKRLIEGLTPNTRYNYGAFTDSDQWSPLGRFQTTFEPDYLGPILVGATSCTASGRAPFPSLSLLAEQPLDLFCHLGDMSYNDGAETLEDFRAGWRRTLSLPEYQSLLSSVGTYQTWDDHEITDDEKLELLPPEAVRHGKRAYFEATPTASNPSGSLWMSYRWGRSAEFFILDCRQERDPELERYISSAQMAWLKSALAESPCHFKVILNSVPIAHLPEIWLTERDRWQGYPEQRDELLDFLIDTPIKNTWFLSGDFHFGALWRVEASGPRSHLWEVLCGPGGSAPSKRHTLATSSPELYTLFFDPEQVSYASGEWAATTILFDPINDRVTLTFISSETGEVAYQEVISGDS